MADDRYIKSHKQVMDDILLANPLVTAGTMFGYPCYKINGKAFCFVGGEGIGIKLPRERIAELLENNAEYHEFYPADGIKWKSWMAIDYADSENYHQHQDLYDESMSFASPESDT